MISFIMGAIIATIICTIVYSISFPYENKPKYVFYHGYQGRYRARVYSTSKGQRYIIENGRYHFESESYNGFIDE